MEEKNNEEINEEAIIPKENNNPVTNDSSQEVNNGVQEEKTTPEKPKKSKTDIIVLILLGLFAICAIIYVFVLKPAYENEKKNNGNNDIKESSIPIPTNDNTEEENDKTEVVDSSSEIEILPTDSEEIKIAKEKLIQANKLFEDSCDGDYYTEEEDTILSLFCYYDTLENFKNKFYNIYSKQLNYYNVYSEYSITTDSSKTTARDSDGYTDGVFDYFIKDNKVYHDHCTMGGDQIDGVGSFTVVNSSSDKIDISYKINYSVFDTDKYTQDASITLVKEDGSWKILKATIIQRCNVSINIGK